MPELGVKREIQVIPNFLDCEVYQAHRGRRASPPVHRRRSERAGRDPHLELPPVKRIDAVVDVFDRIRQRVPARLLLVGDGPELAAAYRVARQRDISGLVHAVGAQEEVVPLLSASDLFLLPSAQESFGLAALEAMACEVPVVASNVGGLPEVIEHGVSGFLHPLDAHDAMAAERHRAAHRSREASFRRAGGPAPRPHAILCRGCRAPLRSLLSSGPAIAVCGLRYTRFRVLTGGRSPCCGHCSCFCSPSH